jgi:hypothetical protein
MLGQRVPTLDATAVKPPPKQADAIYHTPEYERWRMIVIERAAAGADGQDAARRNGLLRYPC